jgi:hypothetical protein
MLLLVSMVSWWNWPRGDARFVGRWELVEVDGHSPKYQETYRYYRNGLLVHSVSGATPSVFVWSIRDDRLVIMLQGRNMIEAMLSPAYRVIAERFLSRPQPVPVPINYRLVRATEDEIILSDEDEDSIKLRRIRE